MDAGYGSLRRRAFEKLAYLSTRQSAEQDAPNINRLVSSLPQHKDQANGIDGNEAGPGQYIGSRELDILLALCSAAAKLEDASHATQAVKQLGQYLPKAYGQQFEPSPYLRNIKPSPWTTVTHSFGHALLNIGTRFPALKSQVQSSVISYVSNWSKAAGALASCLVAEVDDESNEQEAVELAAVSASMIGFLRAACHHASFWTPYERLDLIRTIKEGLTENFLIGLEKAVSTIRHTDWLDPQARDWKRYLRHYAAQEGPLGAMLMQDNFIKLVLTCSKRFACADRDRACSNLLALYMSGQHTEQFHSEDFDDDMLEYVTELAVEQMTILEDGSDYLQLASVWQQRLALSVKAHTLETFAHCMVLDEDTADAEIMLDWLEDAIENPTQMASDQLSLVVLQSLAVVSRLMPESTSNIARIFLRFIVQSSAKPQTVMTAAESLAHVLQLLSADAVITTLYSLGNILSSQSGAEKPHQTLSPSAETNGHHQSITSMPKGRTGSVISLSMSGDEETNLVCGNVCRAIVTVAITTRDPKTIILAQTLLLQKISRINAIVDAHIIEQAAVLAVYGKDTELRSLLRLYSRLHHEAEHDRNTVSVVAIDRAREYLAENLDPTEPLFRIFGLQLLERVLSKGDVGGMEQRKNDMRLAAAEIGSLLKPLSVLASRRQILEDSPDERIETATMAREAWYNIAVHGITPESSLGSKYRHELEHLAKHSMPIFDTERAELLESDVELNIVLRRGMSAQRLSDQKKTLIDYLPDIEPHLKHLSYQKIVFLNAVYLTESLRARSGSCAEICTYFVDPHLLESDMGQALSIIAAAVIRIYVQKARPARDENFAAPYIARQLVNILTACCHRSEKMQLIARAAADDIITFAPSSLIQKSSIFALLELLSIMWTSCLESEINEYEWKPTFSSQRGKVTVHLSDDYSFRKRTLDALYSSARRWMTGVIALSPLDVKGLLQTYLSEYDDTGTYGHVSLGRTFASEMGAQIPAMDQRLLAIDRHGERANVNVASDFIAQYTTRQEYRFGGVTHDDDIHNQTLHESFVKGGLSNGVATSQDIIKEAQSTLKLIENKTLLHSKIDIQELKPVLRRAAALLCRSKSPQTAIVRLLVEIPFRAFSKDAIKMGISLWLGVIHENARMESRILTEIAQAWESIIARRIGIFSKNFNNPDPFYVKEEFAPSDRKMLLHQTQVAQNTISPHLRLLQFFESHFNAIRLGSANTQRTFVRLMFRTLAGFAQSECHPLTREIHFHAVLFGLHVLQYSTCLSPTAMWRLRDRILSAALHWFSKAPMWSFGGNRLQIKAETQVMKDVIAMLASARAIGTPPGRREDESRVSLLQSLLQNEIGRLNVWLDPLHASSTAGTSTVNIASHVRTAWNEDARLAIGLATRFASEEIQSQVRFMLVNFPEKALHIPDALDVMLGLTVPADLSFQLKYLLLWAPVNPIKAVSYFTPAYENQPYLLQYAVRALESHSVDVTFFYVPQIVQALRYDRLGYVARFIVETGKFSQLFAHQIIWNMKANAYKDDAGTVPDELKPTLDAVTERLTSSFTGEDKEFYHREFTFFDEVTDISGKLKPYIKKSKPEKKAKIEEELRKIKVEVGVYLPSNPDGVVVGIDRKSGKPLQSHAKAPYMATFRIEKSRNMSTEEEIIEHSPQPNHSRSKSMMTAITNSSEQAYVDPNKYQVWQSAIFKVGDDCRQDVLALQLIAAFRGIFNSVGLDVYVFPYRVTATAPGCGVIDVLPNSISRDMLGREAVNGLHDYFLTKYGGEHSVRYQEARSEFVKSMAAYSVISYLMQFKDRHNGNIMIDDKGHILHIDFGFLFDISPGGVRFERAPFKLTAEMLAVMGGDDPAKSQAYRWFEELTVKSFLCSRQYCGKLLDLVSLMLESGLPCFKPQTMDNLRKRFRLDLDEADAAKFMLGCIKTSGDNLSTKVYDEFQLLTNGIPY